MALKNSQLNQSADSLDIYHPQEDSYLLAEAVKIHAKGSVLDVGTGSGVQAFTAAKSRSVKKVLAIDINPDAVKHVKKEMAVQKIKKSKFVVKKSDLFSSLAKSSKFDTIIFNPPYLPRDMHETGGIATANCGGKHGYELLVKFINQANNYLTEDGKILIVFSSLTKQMKIDEAIKKNMLLSTKLSEKSFFMEKILVYSIEKTSVLKKLEKKKISNIVFFSEGKRGNIFLGKFKKKQIVIKTKKTASFAESMVDKEALWLRTVNNKFKGKKIAPLFYFSDNELCVMEFIDGKPIVEFLEGCSKADARSVIVKLMKKLHLLDAEGLNKEEMHHPIKHVIVRKDNSSYEPYLIDFERMHYVREGNGKNITQFLIFLSSGHVAKLLNQKGFCVTREEFIGLAEKYHSKNLSFGKLLENVFKNA